MNESLAGLERHEEE